MECVLNLMEAIFGTTDHPDTEDDERLWLLYRMRERVRYEGLPQGIRQLLSDALTQCRHFDTVQKTIAIRESEDCLRIVPEFYHSTTCSQVMGRTESRHIDGP